MTFRSRLTLVAAAAVAVAIAIASAGVYVAVRSVLRGQVDDALRSRLAAITSIPLPPQLQEGQPLVDRLEGGLPEERLGGAQGVIQLVAAVGAPDRPSGEQAVLPVSRRARAVAAGEAEQFFEDVTVAGTHARVLTAPLFPGFAIQIARPLDEVDRTLRRLSLILLVFTLAGIALAAALGRLVARAAVRPLSNLSEATEHVATTHDLSRRIEARGTDELSTLAASFNTMLEALEGSLRAQRQLVADASHELRTPLTSLRTNVEVLARADTLSAEERDRILADVVGQLEELTALLADIVELARGNEPVAETEDVRLDLLVEDALERARRHAPGVRFEAALEPCIVRGVSFRLARAVDNLLDNAAKWSPPGGVVEVRVRDGEITVRDHGPGIAESDLPRVFDRFYRAPAARGRPGSGLGLAIVRQVAEAHGGRVSAERADGGGAQLRLELLATS